MFFFFNIWNQEDIQLICTVLDLCKSRSGLSENESKECDGGSIINYIVNLKLPFKTVSNITMNRSITTKLAKIIEKW